MMTPSKFFSLKKPCNSCLFTKVENAVKLDKERRIDIAGALDEGRTFSCHKTIDYSDEEPNTNDSVLCFGAASVLHRGGHRPVQLEQIATRMGMINRDYEALESANTYESLEDFIENAPGYGE